MATMLRSHRVSGLPVLGHGIADQARHVEGVVTVRDRFTYSLAGPAGSRS
jgi:hypothetical protein